MGLKGDLDTFFLSSILQLICDEKKTGILSVSNDDQKFQIIIKDGFIVYSLGSVTELRIGDMLINQGVISQNQLQECLDVGKKNKMALGKVLVEKKFITLDKLKEYIYKQTEAILFRLLIWDSGSFSYEDVALNTERLVLIRMDVMHVILEAARRIDEMSVFKKIIPSDDIIFRTAGKNPFKQDIELTPQERQIIQSIDGKRSIKDLLRQTQIDKFHIYKTLYSFLSSGHIEKQ